MRDPSQLNWRAGHFRFWHQTDIERPPMNVRFREQGRRIVRVERSRPNGLTPPASRPLAAPTSPTSNRRSRAVAIDTPLDQGPRPHQGASRHPCRSRPCPLSSDQRTFRLGARKSAFDPKRRVVVGERRRHLEGASPLRLRLNQQLTMPLRASKARFSIT
jgi:hypothetical protein